MAVTAVLAGGCDDATWRVHGQSVTAMVEVAWMANRHGGEMDAVSAHAGLFPSRAFIRPIVMPARA